jgi:hypothetical protein
MSSNVVTSVTMGVDNRETDHDVWVRLNVWDDGWTSLDLTIIDWHNYAPKGEHDYHEDEAISWPLIPSHEDVSNAIHAYLCERLDH